LPDFRYVRADIRRYYHRNLNPPKLVDIGFSALPRSMTIARLVKQNAVPTTTSIPGFREMEERDVPQVAALLRRYLARFEVAQNFESDAEVAHWFLSGRGLKGGEGGAIAGGEAGKTEGAEWRRTGQVVWAYVVEVSRSSSGLWV
jgi:glycylpeptide N-tetradecanoyltransferase